MSSPETNTKPIILREAKAKLRVDPSGVSTVNYLDSKVRSGVIDNDEADRIWFKAEREVYGGHTASSIPSKAQPKNRSYTKADRKRSKK